MAGVKGRSGRKSLKSEVDTNELFELSYFTLKRALNSPDIPETKKVEIALAIYTKHLPQKLEHAGKLTVEKIEVEFLGAQENGNQIAGNEGLGENPPVQ